MAVFVKFQHGYCIDTVRRSAVLQKFAQFDIPDTGGAADFKVGYKTGFASGTSEKKYPHFSKCGGTSKQKGPIEYIEICCLVVALAGVD